MKQIQPEDLNSNESKVLESIKENGFNHSIVFLINSKEHADNKLEVMGIAACTGNMGVLIECISSMLERDDKMYSFFTEAIEMARVERNKNNPSVN